MVKSSFNNKVHRLSFQNQDTHIRAKASINFLGQWTCLLANMNSNGDTHQRITYETSELGIEGLTTLLHTRLTSADGKGPTFMLGLSYSK